MTTLTHEACRTAVVLDELDADVTDHLAACADCAQFADRARQLAAASAELSVPPPPAGLADRVIERVAREGTQVAALRRRGRRSLLAAVAVAAAAALVLGSLAVVDRRRDDSPEEVLLAAASRTEAAGAARVDVDGGGEVSVSRTGAGEPDFEAVPDEMQAYMQQRWAESMARFEEAMAAFEAQTNRSIEEGTRAIDEALRQMEQAFGGPAGPRPPRPPSSQPSRRPRPERPEPASPPAPPAPPDVASLGFSFRASGAVDFRDTVRLQGEVQPVAGTVPAPEASGEFSLAAGAHDPGATGPLGSVLLIPDGITRLLRSAQGDVIVGGRASVNGLETRRYRFRAGALDASGVTHAWDVEAYVDRDRLVRRVDLRTAGTLDGAAGRWNNRATVVLSDFGATLRGPDGPPPPAVSSRGSLVVHPFGPALAASLRAGR